MKIEPNDSKGVSTPGVAGTEAGRPATCGGATGWGAGTAELSGLTEKISLAVSLDEADPSPKVESLRWQVAGGTYLADAQATSQVIVGDALAHAAAAGGSARR